MNGLIYYKEKGQQQWRAEDGSEVDNFRGSAHCSSPLWTGLQIREGLDFQGTESSGRVNPKRSSTEKYCISSCASSLSSAKSSALMFIGLQSLKSSPHRSLNQSINQSVSQSTNQLNEWTDKESNQFEDWLLTKYHNNKSRAEPRIHVPTWLIPAPDSILNFWSVVVHKAPFLSIRRTARLHGQPCLELVDRKTLFTAAMFQLLRLRVKSKPRVSEGANEFS